MGFVGSGIGGEADVTVDAEGLFWKVISVRLCGDWGMGNGVGIGSARGKGGTGTYEVFGR